MQIYVAACKVKAPPPIAPKPRPWSMGGDRKSGKYVEDLLLTVSFSRLNLERKLFSHSTNGFQVSFLRQVMGLVRILQMLILQILVMPLMNLLTLDSALVCPLFCIIVIERLAGSVEKL